MWPKISIIVPVFNGERFVGECIESIQSQTIKDVEIIIVNDGSEDNSGKICDEISRRDERITVIHKKNAGPSAARNTGIRYSNGVYIGFVDCDDTVAEDMYEKMFYVINNKDADICTCGYREVSKFKDTAIESIKPLNGKLVMNNQQIKKELEYSLVNNKILGYASLCNKLYKRSFILENNLMLDENVSIAEDLCFNLIALSYASQVCAVNGALYLYRRINDKSIMNTNSFYLHLEARREILNTLRRINISNDVFKHCLKYENSKTVSEYLSKLIRVYNSNLGFKAKFKEIDYIIHERYFLNAIVDFSVQDLVMKARIMLNFLKGYLFLEKKLSKGIF